MLQLESVAELVVHHLHQAGLENRIGRLARPQTDSRDDAGPASQFAEPEDPPVINVVWSFHNPGRRGEISAAVLLSNGSVPFAHQFGVTLIDSAKTILWNYDAPEGCETHTAQPIGKERVVFLQNGPEPKCVVVNIPTGNTEREFPLQVGNPKSTHGQFRHACLTFKVVPDFSPMPLRIQAAFYQCILHWYF